MLPLTHESENSCHSKSNKYTFTYSKFNLFLFPPPTNIYPDFAPDFARNPKSNNKLWPYMVQLVAENDFLIS